MSTKRLITIQLEQTSPPVMDAVVFADDVKTALAGVGGVVVVTNISVIEHAVALVEEESFLGQYQIEV